MKYVCGRKKKGREREGQGEGETESESHEWLVNCPKEERENSAL